MKSVLVRFGLMFLLFAGIIGFISWEEMIISFSEPVDIYEDLPEDFTKVKAVETELYVMMGTFAEEETTTKNKSGHVTSRDYDYYYVLPVFTEEETYYVGVKVDSEKSKPYDKITDETWNFLNGEVEYLGNVTADFQGGFVKMEDELYKYFKEWFEEEEFFETDAEMNKYVLPLVLEPISYKNVKTLTYVMVGLIVVGGIMLFFGLRPGKQYKEPARPMITINGVNYPSSNFETVNKLVTNGDKVKAAKELQNITGIDADEATFVVDKWDEYWG